MKVSEGPNPLGLAVGDVLRDNDARSAGRTITLEAFIARARPDGGYNWYASYNSGHRRCRVAFDRIYIDDKPRSQGYTLVRTEPEW